MLLPIDRHNGVPAYRQIVEQVRRQVASGILRPGEELPSTRALSAELGLNPMTVSKAYSLLEAEGLVERRPGLSLVVRALAADDALSVRRDELRRALAGALALAEQLRVDDAELRAELELLIEDRSRAARAQE